MKKTTALFTGMLSLLSYTNLIAGGPSKIDGNGFNLDFNISHPTPPSPLYWLVSGGNTASATDFVGTSNNQPLNIKTILPEEIFFFTNSIQRMAITSTGDVQVSNFNSVSSLVTHDASNALRDIAFTGNSGDVLSGNGTWVPGSGFSQWVNVPLGIAYVSSPGDVSVGALIPQAKFYVRGSDFTGVSSQFDNGGGTAYSNNLMFFAEGLHGNQDYNQISVIGDNGIFWCDGGARGAFNTSSGFVIAPHKDSYSGLRIDNNGTTAAKKFSLKTNDVDNIVLTSDQGGSIELGGDQYVANSVLGGTPYIDFHYGINGGQDFNMRIINSADGELDFVSSKAVILGASNVAMSILYDPNTNIPYVRTQEIKVCLNNGCDFVFDKDYDLMPLNQLEEYLNKNHHLPGIASAKEMVAEGTISLGKMNMQLLQKVEELTLYTLQLKKQADGVNELKDEVAELKAEISQMKKASK